MHWRRTYLAFETLKIIQRKYIALTNYKVSQFFYIVLYLIINLSNVEISVIGQWLSLGTDAWISRTSRRCYNIPVVISYNIHGAWSEYLKNALDNRMPWHAFKESSIATVHPDRSRPQFRRGGVTTPSTYILGAATRDDIVARRPRWTRRGTGVCTYVVSDDRTTIFNSAESSTVRKHAVKGRNQRPFRDASPVGR